MLQGVLQRGDFAEPGPVLRLCEAFGRVDRHFLDTRQLSGVDPQEATLHARVLVDAGRAVRAVTIAESDLAQQEVVLELRPLLAGRGPQLRARTGRAATLDEVLVAVMTPSGKTAV